MDDTGKRGSTSRECAAQGMGNVASALTGGIGGCALLGQSLINVESGGGKSRLSGMFMAAFLALGIVTAAPILGSVPIPSLVGVMLLVCQSTFSWSSLRILRRVPRLDAAVIALVSFVTVRDDLAKAVVAGTVASALGFAWQQSTSINASTEVRDVVGEDRVRKRVKTYALTGPLFFGSTSKFTSLFDPKEDPNDIVVDFSSCRVMDMSALEAINSVADKYGEMGKSVRLKRMSRNCADMLGRVNAKRKGSGKLPPYEIVESDPPNDPVYDVKVANI